MADAIKTLGGKVLAATTDENGLKLALGVDSENRLQTIGGRPILAQRARRDVDGNEFSSFYAAKSELPTLTQDGVRINEINITTENT